MWQVAIKVLLTAVVVVAVSAIAKRGSVWAGLLASLPLTSLLAFIWLYLDTGDVGRVAALSQSIGWLVLPSLVLLALLPVLLRAGMGFWGALALACFATMLAYYAMLRLLLHWGVRH
jgi:hypothetical protein